MSRTQSYKLVILWFVMIFSACYSHIASAQMTLSKHNSRLPIEINSDQLELFRSKGTATFSDNVTAIQGKLTLKADTLTVYYHEQPKEEQTTSTDKNTVKPNPISKISADGHVILQTPQEKVSAARAIYLIDDHLITLEEKVILQQGKSHLKGNQLIYNLETGQSTLDMGNSTTNKDGRVRGIFVPK